MLIKVKEVFLQFRNGAQIKIIRMKIFRHVKFLQFCLIHKIIAIWMSTWRVPGV